MVYQEVYKDIFTCPIDYRIVHCISADFKLGAGIAKRIADMFYMKEYLLKEYPDYLNEWSAHNNVDKADCLMINVDTEEGYVLQLFNLVTKTRYYDKPTYGSITKALQCLKEQCTANNIKRIAMPQIGCGLDKLEWTKVSKIIKDIFESTDIEILVCIHNPQT